MSDYLNQDVKLRAELIGGQLCFSVAGKEDFKVISHADGHTEFAFLASLDNIEEIALFLLHRVKDMKKYEKKMEKAKKRKEGVKDESGSVLARGRKSGGSEKADQHCSD